MRRRCSRRRVRPVSHKTPFHCRPRLSFDVSVYITHSYLNSFSPKSQCVCVCLTWCWPETSRWNGTYSALQSYWFKCLVYFHILSILIFSKQKYFVQKLLATWKRLHLSNIYVTLIMYCVWILKTLIKCLDTRGTWHPLFYNDTHCLAPGATGTIDWMDGKRFEWVRLFTNHNLRCFLFWRKMVGCRVNKRSLTSEFETQYP